MWGWWRTNSRTTFRPQLGIDDYVWASSYNANALGAYTISTVITP